jgi:hypothetical protein
VSPPSTVNVQTTDQFHSNSAWVAYAKFCSYFDFGSVWSILRATLLKGLNELTRVFLSPLRGDYGT